MAHGHGGTAICGKGQGWARGQGRKGRDDTNASSLIAAVAGAHATRARPRAAGPQRAACDAKLPLWTDVHRRRRRGIPGIAFLEHSWMSTTLYVVVLEFYSFNS